MKLTPKQKEEKLLRDRLATSFNRCKSKFSFKDIKTFKEMLHCAGYSEEQISLMNHHPHELSEALTLDKIKSFFDDRRIELEASIYLSNNTPLLKYNDQETVSEILHSVGTDVSRTSRSEENAIACISTSSDARKIEVEEKDKDYGLWKSEKEKSKLFWFQKRDAKIALDKILNEKLRAVLLLGGVGTGKTYIVAAILRRLLDANWHKQYTRSPYPYIYVTKASIVEQTKRVLEKQFSITSSDVLVINIDQLRSKFGEMFIDEKIVFDHGQEYCKRTWRDFVYPCMIIWDECQALKNADSQQSQIAQSFNELPDTFQIFASATPFTRVIEAKCFSVATRVPYKFGIGDSSPLTNEHWTSFAKEIASPAEPEEHSPAAIDRLMDKLDKYVIRVKGVHPQYHALNSVQMIDFDTEEDRQFYYTAYERFLKEKAKIEAMEGISGGQSRFMILVEMLKFRQAAELCRARHLAKAMWEAVNVHHQAAVCAVNFKQTITKIVKILHDDFNVSREEVSLIWGGGAKAPTKKQKLKAKLEANKDILAQLTAAGISFSDIDLDDVEAQAEKEEHDPSLKLGIQSLKERNHEIKKFQSGKSLYCLYTFRAGGVGLSLHHTDEYTTQKVRHKESGYAVEEDIALIPTRQRVTFVAPTWSAIELVQGLGRAPRLTSLSDTPQVLIFYRGTIEERVAHIVSMKLRCLSKVVRAKEDWSGCIVGNYTDTEVEQKQLTDTDVVSDEEENNIAEEEEE